MNEDDYHLDDFYWIDPYEGGELEMLKAKVERLEALVLTMLSYAQIPLEDITRHRNKL